MTSFPSEVAAYVGHFRAFSRRDWSVYVGWVGLMVALAVASAGFLAFGRAHGADFPEEAFFVPIGAATFAFAIAVDTIGHRTVYKPVLEEAEGLVHGITIACGIGSCVALSAAYAHRSAFFVPALVLTVLSFAYSFVDEAFHWRRYVAGGSGRVEMWSHVLIFVGHGMMMVGWWAWFLAGYPGVATTLAALPGAG